MPFCLTSPEEYVVTDYPPSFVTVFLAGGITGCPDWQAEMETKLEGIPNLVTFNPRRPSFDVRDPSWSVEQIAWEHRHLSIADYTLFWFPKEGMCMITLFELGKLLGQGKPIFLGCHPEYVRAFDVQQQARLMRPWLPIAESVEELAQFVQSYLTKPDQVDDGRCHSDCDGDCTWKFCPQLRDNEPHATGRHCPNDNRLDSDY